MNAPGGPSPPRSSERPLGSIVAVLVVVAAVAIVGWKSFAGAGRDEPAPAAHAVVSPPPVAAASAPLPETASEDAGLATAGPSGTELVEVCGIGWVQPDASGSIEAALRSVPEVVASQRALLESLRQDDGEVGIALATFLELHGAARAGAQIDPALSLACKSPDCATSDNDRRFASTRIEQLASLASTTRDPRVYRLAMKACTLSPSVGSCALLNTAQWALLADGNAAPWVGILQDALQRNDATQIDEALYRIGAAARYDDDSFFAAGLIADRAGAQGADLIASELLAVDAATTQRPPPFQAMGKACSVTALGDANRHQACDNAAATLAERSNSFLALAIGTRLGRRLGWSDDRIDAIRGLLFARDAMLRESDPVVLSGNGSGVAGTCDGARRVVARLSTEGRVGEVQAVRDWVNATAIPIAVYASEAHEAYRRSDETAAANATAAGPAPAASTAVSTAAPASAAMAATDASAALAATAATAATAPRDAVEHPATPLAPAPPASAPRIAG